MTDYDETCHIVLKGLEIDMNIGLHEAEKHGPQRMLIDVELDVGSLPPGEIETEGGVVDYDFIRRTTAEIAAGGHVNYQETLAGRIADACLTHDRVKAVTVYTRKPDIYPDCESVGIRLSRKRR